MRRAHSRLFAIGIAASLPACGDEGPGPELEPEPPVVDTADAVGWRTLQTAPLAETGARHDDVYFIDDTQGWVVNIAGEVHGTSDGGTTWAELNPQTGAFNRAVGFASPTLGWIGNLNGFTNPDSATALFETTDGGVSWTNISSRISGPDPVGVCGLWVADASTIYGVGRWHGPAHFLRSTDGGATWESQDLSSFVTGLVDVHFFTPETGLIIGGRGVGNSVQAQESSIAVVLGTEDGGDTWEVRYEGTTLGSWGWKFAFPTPDIGYAALQGPSSGGLILKTTDGGQSWNELTVDPEAGFSGIGFANASLGWVGGDRGLVFQTENGGANWEPVRLGDNINRFRMLASGVGFSVGLQVYKYEP